jgi:hypothetical protein
VFAVAVMAFALAALGWRSVMWLRSNRPSAAAADGVQRMCYKITAARQVPDAGAPSLAEPSFEYEWDRLTRSSPSAERQLLVLLSQLAGDVVLAEYLVRAGQAACSYSCRMPPSRSRRRIRSWAISSGSEIGVVNGYRGRAFARPWWGRVVVVEAFEFAERMQ